MDTLAKSNPDWQPAGFYQVEGAALRCTLCPHACRLAEGETGFCQVRRHWQGRLETATFASAVQHLDAIERKPFYHVRPGSRVLTLAAPGCSFTCRYCQNYRLSQFGRTVQAPWQGTSLNPAAVVAEAVQRQAALALSYSEPSLAAELTLALAAEAGPQGVPLLWKSNGFLTLTALGELAPVLTAVNIDLKAADEHRHQALTGAPLAPVLAAIEGFLAAGVWVELSTPLIPKFNSDAVSLQRLVALVRALGQDIPWHLLRFSPEYRLRRARPTAPAVLAQARQLAQEAGLRYVYVERACGEAARHTVCPNCGTMVVMRNVWAMRAITLVEGRCGQCGYALPGRW